MPRYEIDPEYVRKVVERTCAEQGVPVKAPPHICAAVAAIIGTRIKREPAGP